MPLVPLAGYAAFKASACTLAEDAPAHERQTLARAFCKAMLSAFWDRLCIQATCTWPAVPLPLPLPLPSLAPQAQALAQDLGVHLAGLDARDSGYLASSIYTVMLPPGVRSSLGAYYTPPPLVDRLLDLAQVAGFDPSTGNAIDPACGGGAFLAPLALRMTASTRFVEAQDILADLTSRLQGIEIDPFSAWMSQVLLEVALLPLCVAAASRLPSLIHVGDALRHPDLGPFDLVVSNPPYGRLVLDEELRAAYARSLYGHANLYGLFLDLALRLAAPGATIAYLTPASFLGGQYFKALRDLLTKEATPVALDFVTARKGVFEGVLQEAVLTTYVKARQPRVAQVSRLVAHGLHDLQIQPLGSFHLAGGGPWMLPRNEGQVALCRAASAIPTRLRDLGYTVSTGPLVWNRHKAQLHADHEAGLYPLAWAEAVSREGFSLRYEQPNHLPWIEIFEHQGHLLTRNPCVLVQRTTAVEQPRRLVAAVLPEESLRPHGAVVIENHLNILQPISIDQAQVEPATLAALLNSAVVDSVFRCISGSVAVSAYELESLPLPSLEQLHTLEKLLTQGTPAPIVERSVAAFYGQSDPAS